MMRWLDLLGDCTGEEFRRGCMGLNRVANEHGISFAVNCTIYYDGAKYCVHRDKSDWCGPFINFGCWMLESVDGY